MLIFTINEVYITCYLLIYLWFNFSEAVIVRLNCMQTYKSRVISTLKEACLDHACANKPVLISSILPSPKVNII